MVQDPRIDFGVNREETLEDYKFRLCHLISEVELEYDRRLQ